MFTFIIQLFDLQKLGILHIFLVFFVISWAIYIIKLVKASKYKPWNYPNYAPSVSVIVPVVDEPIEVWRPVLNRLKTALMGLDSEVIIVPNGTNAKKETAMALEMGFNVYKVPTASKRLALQEGAKHATKEISVILDSDTFVTANSIKELIRVFSDNKVGGAVPQHKIFARRANYIRVICDWLEDIRFNEVLKGQTQSGSVGCLCGRLLAVRTHLLKELIPELVSETFLGSPCISGDDRFLTSWLLQHGWETIYVPNVYVETNAPDTLKGFVKQRLRWSRTSFRETLLSLPWIWKHPFTAFTTLANVVMRWFYFVVIFTAILTWFGLIDRQHYFNLETWQVVVGTIVGFFVSGFLRQLRHLINHPKDLKYLPVFLLVTAFVLTVVEWYGNISVRESNWLTRKVEE